MKKNVVETWERDVHISFNLQELSYRVVWRVIVVIDIIYWDTNWRSRRGPCPVRVRLEFILSGKTSGSSGWSLSSSPPPASGRESCGRCGILQSWATLGSSKRPPGRYDQRRFWISARTRWSLAPPLWSCRCRIRLLGWVQFHCGMRSWTGETKTVPTGQGRRCRPAWRSCSCGGWGRWWRCSRNPRIRT